jgi:hypothetical protein
MLIQTSGYINVRQRSLDLSLDPPTGLALLPRNFETAKTKADLVYESSAADIRALWLAENIIETRIDGAGKQIPYIKEAKYEWILPPILIGAAVWSKDPYVAGFALAVVANYVTDYVLKGRPSWSRSNDVSCEVIVERLKGNEYLKIHYKGPSEELNKLIEKVARVAHDE